MLSYELTKGIYNRMRTTRIFPVLNTYVFYIQILCIHHVNLTCVAGVPISCCMFHMIINKIVWLYLSGTCTKTCVRLWSLGTFGEKMFSLNFSKVPCTNQSKKHQKSSFTSLLNQKMNSTVRAAFRIVRNHALEGDYSNTHLPPIHHNPE